MTNKKTILLIAGAILSGSACGEDEPQATPSEAERSVPAKEGAIGEGAHAAGSPDKESDASGGEQRRAKGSPDGAPVPKEPGRDEPSNGGRRPNRGEGAPVVKEVCPVSPVLPGCEPAGE